MKKFNVFKRITAIIAIVLLIGGCFYFFSESKKPDNKIFIGTPVDNNRINYGSPIKSIEDANSIQFALMKSISIEKPNITDKLPDAVIRIDDYNGTVVYLLVDVWIENDEVIFASGNKDSIDGIEYKETIGDIGKDVIRCISKYKIK